MNNLSKRVTDISTDQQDLLTEWLNGRGSPDLQNIPRRSHPRQFAQLSYDQERLWFLDQLEPNNPFYNVPIAVRLKGLLNASALEKSLNEIVRRHEILRTTFDLINGQVMQIISPALTIKLRTRSLEDLPEDEREREVLRLAGEEARKPFDLARGPLFRASLLQLGEQDRVALFTTHHIISDGWSVSVFIRELVLLYDAFSKGRASPLPELPIQYADFAEWQREWLKSEGLQSHLAYWKRQLAGAPPRLNLPIDRPRPSAQSFRGATLPLDLNASLTSALRSLGRQKGATLFMCLLAGFNALLYFYTKQEDLIVGTDIMNRNFLETEGLIGLLVNQLVLRTNLSGNPTFKELIVRVRETAVAAYAYQEVPFNKLVEAINPDRSLDRSPLFQVKFIVQNVPPSQVGIEGLNLSRLAIDQGSAQLDLILNLTDVTNRMIGTLEYSTDLFDAATINRMLARYVTLLSFAVENADATLNRIVEVLAEADRQEISAAHLQTYKRARRKPLSQP